MPKERIEGLGFPNSLVSFDLTVGWGRDDGEIQIGLLYDRRTKDEPESLSALIQSLPENEQQSLNQLWFTARDRRKINELIQLLRRARDQAFGKDE